MLHRRSLFKITIQYGRQALSLTGALLFAALLVFALPRHSTIVHAAPDQKALGATLFHERGCEHCHGANGTGGELGPDLSTIGKRWSKQKIATQIHDGGSGMPAFADALLPDEITALVEYLHTKKKPAKPHPAPAPADNLR